MEEGVLYARCYDGDRVLSARCHDDERVLNAGCCDATWMDACYAQDVAFNHLLGVASARSHVRVYTIQTPFTHDLCIYFSR
jgi:hypothetical protein